MANATPNAIAPDISDLQRVCGAINIIQPSRLWGIRLSIRRIDGRTGSGP
jgi:hypothetical protein